MNNQGSSRDERFTIELSSFDGLWTGGYFEGDPLHPMARSNYGQLGYLSVLHATYLRCIKPYVTSKTVALEIGPGRGAWTKALLPSQTIYALDALPAQHNRFYEYLGHPQHVKYIQVQDFDCVELPEDYFNYMFSFGCLCHVSFDGITQYAKNIFPKLRSGSNCFWMIADYKKNNDAIANLESLSSLMAMAPPGLKYSLLRLINRLISRMTKPPLKLLPEDDFPTPGRWYHAGVEQTCGMLQSVGYHIVDPDVGTCLRDPIIHFQKP